jgi:glycine/D-amino acid oxidase-like deaminating enzyme
MANFDILILGAGIVGCACACEFAEAGFRVGLVEPNAVAGAATGAAMGHIVVLDDSPAQLAFTAYARSLWLDLQPQLPQSVEARTPGTLWIAEGEEEMAALPERQRAYSAAGVAAELLDAQALAQAEPHLRQGLAGALLVPEDGVLEPGAAAFFFFDQAVRAGAVLLQGEAIRAKSGTVELSDGSLHTAAHIVIATGAAMHLSPWLPLIKRKGQLVLTAPGPEILHHQIVELGYLKSAHGIQSESIAFNVQPRSAGRVLIGSSRQIGTDDPAVDQTLLGRMVEHACRFMPVLHELSHERAWAGFRAATPDKIPYLGPTDDPTILLALGFEGLGITTAPAAARLLLDHVLDRASAIDRTPFLPERIGHSTTRSATHPLHA